MKIDKQLAEKILREEAAQASKSGLDAAWLAKIEKLSELCQKGVSKTHIAFLGTEILAKSINRTVDLLAIKPNHAPDNPNAYSARTLCHSVLVPLAAELGFSIGVTGREPLNNQPYFRMTRLGDGTPVHAGGRAAFDFMTTLVKELQQKTEGEARAALRAFIAVRTRYLPRYQKRAGEAPITPEALVVAIKTLVGNNSEGGKRAQAIVAGLMDVFAGVECVESGRINDPSRKYPGDVCVRSATDHDKWVKAIEVRDKPVGASDVRIFAQKCASMGVREAAVVMVADSQEKLESLEAWASEFGIGLTLFDGWQGFVDQALFWADLPKPDGATASVAFIHERLLAVEALPEAVTLWDKLTRA